MALSATCCRTVMFVKRRICVASRMKCLPFSTNETISADQRKQPSKKKRLRKSQRKPTWTDNVSWEDRLADVVTPLWRLSYEEQLEVKLKHQRMILSQLCGYLSADSQSSTPVKTRLNFPVLPVLPSPVRDGYRNKSSFSVNRGVDGNPKTVGFYIGRGKEGNIICVNGDHLLNMPEKHKLVARCYQDFVRLSSLEPCLLFHTGGHWREVTVRTNAEGHTMVIVYFHPQTLTPEDVAHHKAELVDYFTRGPGSVCQLDSLFFQESKMTRCTHEKSPYQLLYGQPHMYEEVLGFKFRISADAFFQVNRSAAEVLYRTVRDLCVPNQEDCGGTSKAGGTLLDVCCGTGAIGITTSPRVGRIIGVELVEQAVEDARHNAALNNVLNCEFIPGKAEVVLPGLMSQLSSAGGDLSAAVVNPSRAGLHYRVVRALRNQPGIRRLVFVSCKPDGEAMRNFRELCCPPEQKLTGKAFTPTLAVPVDMFPHTPHCELVLLFER
ncbi:tRNA (uracil(54)-C(5))-methyltransferase homolog-B [Notolabrus celidotus]|uniref:tRNA (uracil(54)-C(5))-methyltransferase homolog-B n=1 Tax=Notolabrus celidotus TaxID=1203425 RepID=UPI00148F86F3|nr:tRNA (uracil(54)-C(5))-methyltransferase homolog-B [Notolabrus celidotus]